MLGKDPSNHFLEMGHVDENKTYTRTVEAGRRTCDEKGVWDYVITAGWLTGTRLS